MFKIVPSKNLFSYLSLQKEVARISNYWRQKWGWGGGGVGGGGKILGRTGNSRSLTQNAKILWQLRICMEFTPRVWLEGKVSSTNTGSRGCPIQLYFQLISPNNSGVIRSVVDSNHYTWSNCMWNHVSHLVRSPRVIAHIITVCCLHLNDRISTITRIVYS